MPSSNVAEKIVKEYWQKGIENFGMEDEKYIKLSNLIQDVVVVGVKDIYRQIFSH